MPASINVLISKNFQLEIRTVIITLIEILVVFIFYLIVAFDPINDDTKHEIDAENAKNAKTFDENTLENLNTLRQLIKDKGDSKLRPYSLAYTPNDEKYETIVNQVVMRLDLKDATGYTDEKTMVDKFDSKKVLAGIVFDADNDIRLRFPGEFRTFKSKVYVFDNLWVSRCTGVLNQNGNGLTKFMDTDLYIREGFLQLQHHLVAEWLSYAGQFENRTNNETLPEVVMRSFRQHTDKEICQKLGTSNLMLLLYSFTFFIPFLNFLWQYGREREKNLLAHHWRYGIGYPRYWFSHFLVSMCHLLILDAIIIILVKLPMGDNAGRFMEEFYIILAFLLLHNIALVLTVIALVSVWMKALHAVLFGATLWISMYSMFSILVKNITQWGVASVFSTLLFFNNIFEYGMHQLRKGSNENETNDLIYPFSILAACCLLAWIFITIAEYYSPGQYIETKPFKLFSVIKLRDVMNKPDKEDMKKVQFAVRGNLSWENFEYGPVNGIELMRLMHVSVTGSGKKQILKNITLRVFNDEITVILGPHCSGKTTLIKIMAGWKRPTSGKIEVEQKNLYSNWNAKRHLIDVSMPNNQLFDYLTIEETIRYYAKLKLPKKDDQKVGMELDKWLRTLKLVKMKPEVMVKKLTFDQKRLLTLCCVLAADTKIIILDEPTLHMRSPYQRFYWDILHREKPGRAIVLTTFDVREAESLADRIAFLNGGTLFAYGTPFFIKNRFGYGCDLIIMKSPSAPTEPITGIVARFIPDIIPDNEIGDQVIYKLPIAMRPKFQHMLIHLEKESEKLTIYDLRLLSSEVSEAYQTSLRTKKIKQVIVSETKTYNFVSAELLDKQQTYALFYKKLIHQAPNILPLVIIGISFFLILLLAYLAEPLYLKAVRDNKIILGDHDEIVPEREVDRSETTCPILEIYDIEKVTDSNEAEHKITMIFERDKFQCQTNFEDYLSTSQKVSLNFGAMERKDEMYVGWINQNIFHSAPLVLNLIHNIFLDGLNLTTKITNDPFPPPLTTKISLLDQQKANLILPMVLGVIVPISIAVFITPLVEERLYHLLTLQKMTGISMFRYWGVNFFWDFSTFFSYTIIYVIVLACSSVEGFSFSDKMLIMLLMNVYGIAGLATIYVLSMFFHKTLWSAFLIAVLVQVTTGIFLFIIYWDVAEVNIIFFYISMILPPFAFMNGISNVYTETKEELYCDEKCRADLECSTYNMCEVLPNCCSDFAEFFEFAEPGIMPSIVAMLLSSIVLFIILTIIEKRRAAKKYTTKRDIKHLRSATYAYDDKDVVDVKKEVAAHDYLTSLHKSLMVDQLEYEIPKTGKSLDTVSFQVNKGQCLGIYGTRHSGKSHLTGQLVGEVPFAFGDVYVEGHELKYDTKQACLLMSYVPQDGGYWETFTPRELLRFFCLLRGIKITEIKAVLHDLSLTLNMANFMDRRIGTLSVDRRRKVNIAVAMIPNNRVIVLDEPTRGLSSQTSREIWNVLRYKRFSGKTIVFTTSDAIELEALSDNGLVYDEGEMLAYGGTQYLRERYTRGFYLDVKLRRDGATAEETNENFRKDSENLSRFVTFLHEHSELQVRYDNWFRFYCPVPKVIYSFLYGTMEKNKRRLNIADYFISQGSLENAIAAIGRTRTHKE